MRHWHDSEGGGAVVAEGIVAGTRIATAAGWRPAEALTAGDLVLTFEAGMQPLAEVRRAALGSGAVPGLWPLRVPAGVLDTREDVLLLPEQKVLLESDLAEEMFGDPFALVPAAALEGWRGIGRVAPRQGTQVLTLCFAAEQIVYASRAALIACPGVAGGWFDAPGAMARRADVADYAALTLGQARHLVACLMAEDVGAALRPPPRQAAFAAGANRP